jgi:Xaa-Pro aminopeptidase
MDLEAIQSALREARLDGWLFYDHHHRDPIAYRILGLDEGLHITRRWYYYVPASGTPRKLAHRIESLRLDALPGTKQVYSSWQELEQRLKELLTGAERIAMQYSPRNAIMYVSMVDAGTVEVLRELGKTIVSSADLVSRFEAVLTPAQIESHYAAQRRVDNILEAGFREIGRRVRSGIGITEYEAVEWLRRAMADESLEWEHGPNVSVNQNSANPHYEPTAQASAPIRSGDFLLIDIWARRNKPGTCWYDITWTGVVDRDPTAQELGVFEVVRGARDAAVDCVQQAFAAGRPIAGWEADDAARSVIRDAGYAAEFTHRTGHNISNELHGNGAHLDNLETHDERRLLPYTCFSIEPGIYLEQGVGILEQRFGIRSEVNMMTSEREAVVTGRLQTELLII